MSSDTRAQLKFLEKLEHMEKQRKNEEQREALFRAAKVRKELRIGIHQLSMMTAKHS